LPCVAQALGGAVRPGDQDTELLVAEDTELLVAEDTGPASSHPGPVAVPQAATRSPENWTTDSPPPFEHAARIQYDHQGHASPESVSAEWGTEGAKVPLITCAAAPAPSSQVLAEVAAVTGIKRQRRGKGHRMHAASEPSDVNLAGGDSGISASSEDLDIRHNAIEHSYVPAEDMPSDEDYWVCALHT
jgi:hypothetical protein